MYKHLTIVDLVGALQRLVYRDDTPPEDKRIYVETGRYKPYNTSVIAAAKRRGFRVEKIGIGVYYVYPLEEIPLE